LIFLNVMMFGGSSTTLILAFPFWGGTSPCQCDLLVVDPFHLMWFPWETILPKDSQAWWVDIFHQ
jgi:hypothetical protein